MKCIAHRGYSLLHKDNSVEAIREAIHRNYDGVEIDVQLCESGELVLHHDVYIGNHFIGDLSLKKLRGMGVCSLKEIYEKVPDIRKSLLFVDIKGNDMNVVNALEKFYTNEPVFDVIFCSFNRKIVYKLPRHFRKGSTFETTFHKSEFPVITSHLDTVMIHWTCLDHDFIDYCRDKGIGVYTYTHKEDKELEYMYRYKVDGFVTNGF